MSCWRTVNIEILRSFDLLTLENSNLFLVIIKLDDGTIISKRIIHKFKYPNLIELFYNSKYHEVHAAFGSNIITFQVS